MKITIELDGKKFISEDNCARFLDFYSPDCSSDKNYCFGKKDLLFLLSNTFYADDKTLCDRLLNFNNKIPAEAEDFYKFLCRLQVEYIEKKL